MPGCHGSWGWNLLGEMFWTCFGEDKRYQQVNLYRWEELEFEFRDEIMMG